jgi:hypothetical protein
MKYLLHGVICCLAVPVLNGNLAETNRCLGSRYEQVSLRVCVCVCERERERERYVEFGRILSRGMWRPVAE